MTRAMRLDLPVVLPGVGIDDACVGRLATMLGEGRGVASVHVLQPGEPPPFDAVHGTGSDRRPALPERPAAALCLHYDPGQLTMADVADMSLRAAARLARLYGHVTLPMQSVSSLDQPLGVPSALQALPGVTSVRADHIARVVRVEYEVGATNADCIRGLAEAPEVRPSLGLRLARRIRALLRRH